MPDDITIGGFDDMPDAVKRALAKKLDRALGRDDDRNPNQKAGAPWVQAERLNELYELMSKAPAKERFNKGDLVMQDPALAVYTNTSFPHPGYPAVVAWNDLSEPGAPKLQASDPSGLVTCDDMIIAVLLQTDRQSLIHFAVDSRFFVPFQEKSEG